MINGEKGHRMLAYCMVIIIIIQIVDEIWRKVTWMLGIEIYKKDLCYNKRAKQVTQN